MAKQAMGRNCDTCGDSPSETWGIGRARQRGVVFMHEAGEQESEGDKPTMQIYTLYPSTGCGDWCEAARCVSQVDR